MVCNCRVFYYFCFMYIEESKIENKCKWEDWGMEIYCIKFYILNIIIE